MAALEPPGNIAREIALFRRRLFAASGDPSALAFPELVPLAIGRISSKRPIRLRRRDLEHLFDSAWEGVTGSFRLGQSLSAEGKLYLRTEGPVEKLAAAARRLMDEAGFEPDPSPPLRCAEGFFLCRSQPAVEPIAAGVQVAVADAATSPSGSGSDDGLSAAARQTPPGSSFGDAQLVFLRFDSGPDPFAALAWKELGRSRRLRGKPERAGREEPTPGT